MPLGTRELLLGGAGLIGATLAARLRARGHEVVSLDLKEGCDLRCVNDAPFLACDRVWFLAWDTGGAKYIEAAERQHEQYRHNCELSARIFDALAHTRKPFLFTTSQLAGRADAYGLTKLMAEHWARQLGGKLARLWNTYGWEPPGVRSHVVTDMVLAGLKRGRVECLTDGAERRRFVYKDDCAAALIALGDSTAETADIAGPEWLTIKEVAEEIAQQLNVETRFGTARGAEEIIDPTNLLPDWRPSISLSEGIARVIAEARTYIQDV